MKSYFTSQQTEIRRVIGGRSNLFLILSQQSAVLVDTSTSHHCMHLISIVNALKDKPVKYLVITHAHFDHAANARAIKQKFGCKLVIHEAELPFLQAGDTPMPAGTNWFTRFLSRKAGEWMRKYVAYAGCEADICLRGSDEYQLTPSIRIMHTPGHTEGSVSLIVDDEIAITGDTIFGVFPRRCFPPFANDIPKLLASWQKLAMSGCKLFLPSHGNSRSLIILEKELVKYKIAPE